MLKIGSEAKVNNQTILEEHIDVNYEPTPEEIYEYATYIGIDPEKVNYRWNTEFSAHFQSLIDSFFAIGTSSIMVSPRRHYETIATWMETLSRWKRRIILLQFWLRFIVMGSSVRWNLQEESNGRKVMIVWQSSLSSRLIFLFVHPELKRRVPVLLQIQIGEVKPCCFSFTKCLWWTKSINQVH